METERFILRRISTSDADELFGSCGFHNWVKEHHKAKIGYEVAPKCWRKGVITEVLREVIRYGFEMDLHRIEGFYDPKNVASKRSLEKAGFSHEGVLRECFLEKGKYVDAAVCSLLIQDFLPKQ